MMEFKKSFASDNCATAHPRVMERLFAVNAGHALSYGDDAYTQMVQKKLCELFGGACEAHFVFNGSGANAVCLNAMCPTWGGIICTELAHINCDETGAVEHLTGGKLYALRGNAKNKLTVEEMEPLLKKIGSQHASQPKVISITQCTETGTVYKVEEVRAIADFAHANGMLLHMDGARFANAVAALGCTPAALTRLAGVDALSFGLSKNGGMFGEAVVCFKDLNHMPYVRKSCTQLISKMRFIAAQFDVMLEDNLWLRCAAHANAMAKRLSEGICTVEGAFCAAPTEANEVFVVLPNHIIEPLRAFMDFHDADFGMDTVRLVASHDTTEAEVDAFIAKARELVAANA
ncbi:MAG: aminotransferase class I/II-fold pyridoxal phosphate-dependent enzyme [Eubacteriales bacterium]|nr:aminotransferase class I/II-fold pyridoxal phosphate-dependent enzyme [Eubacteriales bacterium]